MIGSNSDKKGANRANCRICYGAQVDSLLYRYLALIAARIFTKAIQNTQETSNINLLGIIIHSFQVWAYVHLFQVCPWIALGHRKMSNMWNPHNRCCPCIYTLVTHRLTGFCSRGLLIPNFLSNERWAKGWFSFSFPFFFLIESCQPWKYLWLIYCL